MPESTIESACMNGIGFSEKMFMEVFRYFGRSRNAFDPTISGMFGLGAKSFVMLVGDKGSMVIHTRSRETDECYKMYARKVGFDVLPNEDRGYGTSFTFVHDPGFNKLHVIKAIGDYSRYVRVPVNFTITGSPVTVDNTDRQYPHTNQPETVILEPSGSVPISMISPELVLDTEIEKSIKRRSREYYPINIYVCKHHLLNTNMGTTITTRVSEDLEEKIEKISLIEHMDKSTVIRRLLSNAVHEWLIDHVLMQYQQEKITIGKAARMVGIPLREMIAIASRKCIPFQYSLDDLREDFQAAEKL